MRSLSFIPCVLLLFILLAACGQKDTPAHKDNEQGGTANTVAPNDTPLPTQHNQVPIEVATTDEPINLPSPATGLAFWEHPGLPFRGTIIAATQNGIFAHTLEGAEPVDVITDIKASGGAIAYFPASLATRIDDRARQGVFVTFDLANSAYRFFRVDNATGTLREDIISLPVRPEIEEPTDFCLISGLSETDKSLGKDRAALTLISLEENEVTVYDYVQNASTQWAVKNRRFQTSIAAEACAYDHRSGEILLIDLAGILHSFDPVTGNTASLVKTGITKPGAIGIHNSSTFGANGLSILRSFLLVVNEENGQIHVYDLASKELVGLIRLADFDVISGVVQASAMTVASGNYGGLYRSGAIALGAVESNEENSAGETGAQGISAAVRLTPFIAVSNGLSLDIDNIVSDRKGFDQGTEVIDPARPDISIELDELTP